MQEGQDGCARVLDCFADQFGVGDVEFVDHDVADHFGGVGDEFVYEDVVVDTVTWRGGIST